MYNFKTTRLQRRAHKRGAPSRNKSTFNGMPVQIIQMGKTHKVIRHLPKKSDGKYKPAKTNNS